MCERYSILWRNRKSAMCLGHQVIAGVARLKDRLTGKHIVEQLVGRYAEAIERAAAPGDGERVHFCEKPLDAGLREVTKKAEIIDPILRHPSLQIVGLRSASSE